MQLNQSNVDIVVTIYPYYTCLHLNSTTRRCVMSHVPDMFEYTQNISFVCVCNFLCIYKTYARATPFIDIIILCEHHTMRIIMIFY